MPTTSVPIAAPRAVPPDPCTGSASALLRALRGGTLRARDALEACLARIDAANGAINAVVQLDQVGARRCADAADAARRAGHPLPPLHGLPMTVKESFDVAGMPTTWGVPSARGNIARTHALAVQRLVDAGANVFGKTNVPIHLGDFQSYNEVYGTTRNPWRHDRTSGGSSGGAAAALAAGMTALELGSDIGGSIRNPAHYCGVFGHKPTWNLLPPRGHSLAGLLAPTDISVIGPLARSAHDLELALRLLARPDEIDVARHVALPELAAPTHALRIALWRDDAHAPVHPDVAAKVDAAGAALAAHGAQVDTAPALPMASAALYDLYYALLLSALGTRMAADEYHALTRLDPATLAGLTAENRRYAAYSVLHERDWQRAHEARTRLRGAWHRFFEHYDAILMPVMPTTAFAHDHRPFPERSYPLPVHDADGAPLPYFRQNFWAGIAGVSLLPATVVPAGLGHDGLPIGVQVVGPQYGDLVTIQIAQRLEALGFAFTPPPGAPPRPTHD